MQPFCFPSPEWVLDSDVAVHSDGQQAEDGALGKYEDEARDEQAAEEVGTKANTDVDFARKRKHYRCLKSQCYVLTNLAIQWKSKISPKITTL